MSTPLAAMDIFFYIFGAIAIVTALSVVLGKNPIVCAFSLVAMFFCIAANYAMMDAHFLAAIQILVYAGAIMVLFVFVIMLLNADIKNLDVSKNRIFQIVAAILSLSLCSMFVFAIKNGATVGPKGQFSAEKIQEMGGNVQVLSQVMFSDYILPFEITSILLLVGIVGSVALAKRKLEQK